MGIFLERLRRQRLLVSDGAWGTMLQAQSLAAGSCPEEWNLSHPQVVAGVAAAYASAGADVVLTNTFGGCRVKLAKFGLADKVAAFNAAGAALSRQGAPQAVVAASIGPTGEFLQPLGDMTAEQVEEVFAEQIEAVLAGGAQAVCIETMTAIEEALCAVRAAKKLKGDLDVIATMTFDPRAGGGFATMMGVTPAQAACALTAGGADVVGANCGNGMANMIPIAAEFRRHTDRPILIHANAGVPELVGGRTVFRETPADMAGRVRELVSAGAAIVGGCCGTTPAHVAAIRAVIDELR